MRDLREYLNEGIFDTTADDVDRALCVDAFRMITNKNVISSDEIEKAFADGDIVFDLENKCMNVYGLVNQLFISKKFVKKYGDLVKCINLEYYKVQSSNHKTNVIFFMEDLNGIDLQGMEFGGFKFNVAKGIKLVNTKLHCLSNDDQMFIMNKFDKVEIIMNDKIEDQDDGSPEFDNKKFPKYTFVQDDSDHSNIFDNVTLIGSRSIKFNVSLACTSVGQEIRRITKNEIPVPAAADPKISALLKSSGKSIAEVDYMYRKSNASDYGEGVIYNPSVKSTFVRRFGQYNSDYQLANNVGQRDHIYDPESL